MINFVTCLCYVYDFTSFIIEISYQLCKKKIHILILSWTKIFKKINGPKNLIYSKLKLITNLIWLEIWTNSSFKNTKIWKPQVDGLYLEPSILVFYIHPAQLVAMQAISKVIKSFKIFSIQLLKVITKDTKLTDLWNTQLI